MKRRGRKRAEGGAAAVEMAIVLSLLFFLLFGIVEGGFIFNRWIQVTHAAREGVRELSIGVPAATAEMNAEGTDGTNTAKYGADAIQCTATSQPDATDITATVVQMDCGTTYRMRLLGLLPIKDPVPLSSLAKMRKE
jgi:Flp pilus assembly protein TadG